MPVTFWNECGGGDLAVKRPVQVGDEGFLLAVEMDGEGFEVDLLFFKE